MAERCQHGRALCSECVIVTDAAKRAYHEVALHVFATEWDERIRGWVAVRLADGGSDSVLYGSKREAVRHQADEFRCAYFSYRNAPNGFSSVRDAQLWLDWHRAAYDAGFRTPDPAAATGGPEPILPTANEHLLGQRSRLIQATRM